jgi:ATP-dependent Clp protease ATP-binding subunit ClpC
MNLSVEAKRYLVNEGTNLKYGARPLRRAIQKYIENPLAEFILNGQLEAGDTVSIDCLSVEKMLAFTKPDLVSGEEIKLLLSEEKNKAEADEKSAEAEKAVGIEETTDAGKTVKKPAGKRKSGTRGKK